MKIIDAFLNASQNAQIIIIGINIFIAVLVCFSFVIKDYRIKIIAFFSTYIALYFLIQNINNNLPLSYFTGLYVVPSLIIGLFFLAIYYTVFPSQKELGIFDIEIPYARGKKIRFNILRGVSVQGSAGSGKTVSIAGWILFWLGQRSMAGLIYDYKNFEFVEVVQWFYRNSSIPIQVFAPHEPDKSIQINPIAPEVLKKPEDIILMSKCIVQNLLGGSNKDDSFFINASEGAIIGVIHVLKDKYPQYCSFTYLSAIFLTKDAEELVTFIEQSENAKIQARAFLDGADSPKQMSAVKASLSNAFRVFAVPNIFYAMQKNSMPLNINNKENLSVLILVNTPKYDDIYSPILSIVAQAVLTSMSERNQEPSYLLFDEAPTLKINRIGKVPATMRSFNIATIYMLQDKIQAQIQMGVDRMKEVLANLSTIFFGKTNDPDTAKFFESYFSSVKIKTKSVSKKDGWMGGTDRRISESEKEEKEHKSYEMFKRSTGEFFVFDEKGNSYDAMIKKPDIEPIEYKNRNMTTEREIKRDYDFILKKAKTL